MGAVLSCGPYDNQGALRSRENGGLCLEKVVVRKEVTLW